jgi:hypothetical protein
MYHRSTSGPGDGTPDYLPKEWPAVINISHLAEFFTPHESEKIVYSMLRRKELPPPINERQRGRCNRWLKADINLWIHLGCPKDWRRGQK